MEKLIADPIKIEESFGTSLTEKKNSQSRQRNFLGYCFKAGLKAQE